MLKTKASRAEAHIHRLLFFFSVQCGSFAPPQKFFPLDYATAAAGRGDHEKYDERANIVATESPHVSFINLPK